MLLNGAAEQRWPRKKQSFMLRGEVLTVLNIPASGLG
jgi:hypothetical protein